MKLMKLIAGAVFAVALPAAGFAATANVTPFEFGGDIIYDYGPLEGSSLTGDPDYFSSEDIDVAVADELYNNIIIEFLGGGTTGSLTIELTNSSTKIFNNDIIANLLSSGDTGYDLFLDDVLILSVDSNSVDPSTSFVVGTEGATLKYVWTSENGDNSQVSTTLTPTAVPLPASALLMLGALGGLGLVRRKRT